jgi:hypothetical protein
VRVMDNDTPMVMVPKVAATVVHCARFPRGSLRLTSLSYQQFDPRRQTGGPRAYLSLAMWVAQGMTAPSTAHDAFPTIARVGKGERISLADSRSLILVSCAHTSPSSSFALELSATFQIPSTACGNGVQPLYLLLPIKQRPQEAEAAARMAAVKVQCEDIVWIPPARWLAVWRVHLLHLLCHGWAHTLVLLLHTIGDLRPLAPPPVATFHHASGDLHSPPPTFYKNKKNFHIGVHIKMHIKL